MADEGRAFVDGSTDYGILDGGHTQGRVRLPEDVRRGRGCALYSTQDWWTSGRYICEEGVGSGYKCCMQTYIIYSLRPRPWGSWGGFFGVRGFGDRFLAFLEVFGGVLWLKSVS